MTTSAQNAAAVAKTQTATSAQQAMDTKAAPANDVLQDVCEIEEKDADNTTFIERPVGVTKEFSLETGKNYIFGFDKDDALSFVQEGNDLKITFNCGGVLILKNYAGVISGADAATFAFSDIVPVGVLGNLVQVAKADEPKEDEPQTKIRKEVSDDAGAKVAKVEPAAGDDVAKKLNQIETAAGDEAGGNKNTGYGFNSPYSTTPVGPLAAVGPIDPTALRYGANFPEPNVVALPQTVTPPLNPPGVEANFGVDNAQVKEDGSVFVPIKANLGSGTLSGDFLTVTVTGIPSTWTITNADGTYDPATGTWTIVMPANTNYNGGLTFFPPAQSDIDLSGLVASATTTRPSTGQSATANDDFGIVVDAVADDPSIDAHNQTTTEGQTISVNIAGALGVDTDGSENIDHYEISGVPAGFTFNHGTNLGGGVWSFTPAELAGLTLTPSNSNYSGKLELTATIFTTENPVSDGEFDTSDNNAQASDPFCLTWTPEIHDPSIVVNGGVENAQVKEDGSVQIPIVANLGANPNVNEYLTVTVTGIDSSWGFSAPVGTYNPATGTWTVVLAPGQNLNTIMTFTPPAQSDIDLSGLVATVVATDPDTGLTANANDGFGIVVDAVADAPSVDATNNTTGEGDPIAVNIAGALGVDTDGSERIDHYEVSGVPAGFTFNHGTNLGGGVWSFTPAQLAGLTLTPPNSGYNGQINLTATIFTTENPVSDGEFDTTDNNAQASDAFTLKWNPEIDEPCIEVNEGVENAQVKEDGSVNVPITAALGANPGAHEYLTVTVTGIDSSWGFSAPVGTYNAATGTWTVVLAPGQSLNTVMTFTPPAQSDIDLSGLVATAVATDPDTGLSANANDGFNIIVDAVADQPTITANDNATGEGDPIAVNIAGALGVDTDGSERIDHYEVSGVPAGFTFNHGTNLGGGVWSFTPAQLAGLTLTPPNAGFNGQLELTARIFTTENPVSDGEFDTTDNNAQASDAFILKWKPEMDEPSIKVNNGVDDAFVKEDGSVNVPIVAQLGSNPGPNEYLTVTVTGINPAWGTFSAPVGTYNPATGTWTITLAAGQNLNTVFTFTPNGDEDIDLTGMVATVVARDPDTGLSASDNDSFNVIVDAVADVPNLDAGSANGEEGTTIPLNITTSVNDTDGSEVIEVIKISNLPVGATLTAGTNVGGVWHLTPAQLVGLGINVPNGTSGNFTLNVESVAFEQNTNGSEPDLSDNRASAYDTIEVCVTEDTVPEIGDSSKTIDETNLGPITVNGTLGFAYNADGPGAITAQGAGSFSATGSILGGSLKSHGDAVTVGLVGNVYTGTAGGRTIFTLTVNGDGTYSFTQLDQLDHANGSDPNDVIALNFGVRITDSDGDADTGTITINVKDDGPVAVDDNRTTGGEQTITGNVMSNDDVGTDENGSVASVTFNGTTTNIPAGGTVTINGAYGTLKISSNGAYEYTSRAADGTDAFLYKIKDFDGDQAGACLTIKVDVDNIPVLVQPETVTVDETNMAPTTLISDTVQADFGTDGPGTFSGNGGFTGGPFTSCGAAVVVAFNSTTNTYTGTAAGATVFTLAIQSNGNYTFTLVKPLDHPNTTNPNDQVTMNFGVRATDADGDAANGFITVNVLDDGPSVVAPALLSVQENEITDVANGTLAPNFGKDGAGSVSTTGAFSAIGDIATGTLKSGGYNVIVTSTPTGYVGTANGVTVFTLTITNATTGAYAFTLLKPLDHSAGGSNITLNFGAKVTDCDGDSAATTISVKVQDDVPCFGTPVAGKGIETIDETNLGPINVSGSLNVVTGADAPVTILPNNSFAASGSLSGGSLKSHGVAVTVTQTADGYVGKAGTVDVFKITVNAAGQYTFTQYEQLDHANGSDPNDVITLKFGVRITDADGDSDTTTITINVKDDAPVAVDDVASAGESTIFGNVLTNDDAGEDGLGAVTAISINGTTVNVASGATVTINGTYGALKISSTGAYEYTKFSGAGGTDRFVYTMKDYDGDTSSAKLSIDAKSTEINISLKVNGNVDDICTPEDCPVFVPVIASFSNGNGNETMTLVLNGVGAGWTLSGAGWVSTGVAGQYKIVLPAGTTSYSGGFTLAPPANSDVDLGGLSVTASVSDPDGAISTPAVDSFRVIVDAVVDAPVGSITMEASTFFWNMWSPQQAAINITGGVTDRDGSEKVTKLVFDLNQPFTNPAGGYTTLESMGFSLNKGVEVSPGIWEIAINAQDVNTILAGLKLKMPAGNESWMPMHQSYSGSHSASIIVRAYIEETNLSGLECDYTNNQMVVTSTLNFSFYLTPLVIDLDNNGIQLLDINAGVMFDMNNNGTLDHTTWVGGHDGLLSIDLNDDGVINNQSELFGGTSSLENGFQNLAQYDLNADGVINASDSVFADLKIWQDLNSDGVSQSEELHGLSHFGISSINLNYASVDYMNADARILQESTVTFEDGREASIVDAWFNVQDGADDQAYTTTEGTELNDAIYGTDGNDILVGLAGNDALHGGSGADVFEFRTMDGSVDTIADFNVEQGDVLDVSGLLEGFDPVQDSINDFVFQTESNGNTTVLVDATGSGNIANATAIAIINGVTGLSIEELTHQAQLAA